MNTNPNGYDGSTLNQFQDAGPLEEGCDYLTCTARVGGDHTPACNRCEWCWRSTANGDYVNVSRGKDVVRCCSSCWEKADDIVDVALDYTTDEPELLREGLPEFNGAFGG